MRLIRVGEQRSRVADDVRAALTALGRGDSVRGGIALVDVEVEPGEHLDAVVVTPHGVVIVAGIDLPGPALMLEAPLGEVWKADRWPLVGSDDTLNPAVPALATADRLAAKLSAEVVAGSPPRTATILAVGPYVESVVTPEPSNRIKVLHPRPTDLRDAIAELLPAEAVASSVEQARAILRAVDPAIQLQTDEVLVKEGFVAYAATAQTTESPAVAANDATDTATPEPYVPDHHEPPKPAADTDQALSGTGTRNVRWLPIAAVVLLVALLILSVVMAKAGAEEEPRPPDPAPAAATHVVDDVTYTEVAAATGVDCVRGTVGDVQAMLEQHGCADMQAASYTAEASGTHAAVGVAVIELDTADDAAAFKELADTPGTGGALDLAAETGQWPGDAPSFDHATYLTAASGTQVILVKVASLDPDSDVEALRLIAENAVRIPR